MEFFSGFGFKNEKALFREWLDFGPYVVAGFSYGAQRALKRALELMERGERVEKLQLISPALFDHLPRPARLGEIQNFSKNPDLYMRFFYKKAAYPYKGDLGPFLRDPEPGELKELLFFEWKRDDLLRLKSAGVQMEVFAGSMDKIVDPAKISQLFSPYATVYTIKGAGHILKGGEDG